MLTSFAQRNSTSTWISVGLKGGFGTSFFFNQPSVDDANITYSYFSPSYFYGGNFGLLFGDFVGFSGEFSFNSLSQGYDIDANESFQRTITTKSTDFAILLNLNAPTGFYFDIGPKFSTLKSATLTTIQTLDRCEFDRTNKFRPEFSSIVFGIGLKPVRTQSFEMKLGIRGAYTLSNFVNSPGYIIPADEKILYMPSYTDENTHPIQLMITTEFTLIFGRVGKASCGKTRLMLNFQ